VGLRSGRQAYIGKAFRKEIFSFIVSKLVVDTMVIGSNILDKMHKG